MSKNILDSVYERYSVARKNVMGIPALSAHARIYDSIDPKAGITKSNALLSVADQGVQATILANFNSHVMNRVSDAQMLSDATGTKIANYGPFVNEVLLPIVTAWYPNFPLKELISVQDVNQDWSTIVVSKLVAGTTKSQTQEGDALENADGPRTLYGSYSTGDIIDEPVADASWVAEGSDYVSTVAYSKLIAAPNKLWRYRIKATINGTDYTDIVVPTQSTGAANGVLTLSSKSDPSVVATIGIATGIVTFVAPAAAPTSVSVSYVWDLETSTPANVPTAVEDLEAKPLLAEPRALAVKYSVYADYVRQKQFGQGVKQSIIERILALLYQEQVRYILSVMYAYADNQTPTAITFPTSVYSLDVVAQSVLRQLNAVSSQLQTLTGRIEGNRLVVGADFKDWLESLPENFYKPVPVEDAYNGPRKLGTFGRYIVYYDDQLPHDAGWMTYRGEEWYDAAYYLGIFMPITPSDAVQLGVNIHQAFCSMEAHLYDKPQAVLYLTFA